MGEWLARCNFDKGGDLYFPRNVHCRKGTHLAAGIGMWRHRAGAVCCLYRRIDMPFLGLGSLARRLYSSPPCCLWGSYEEAARLPMGCSSVFAVPRVEVLRKVTSSINKLAIDFEIAA